jgi:BirA family biotin operon repressor/biotin-[acetyl-CoA-carboxylase] ligase
MKLKLLKFKSVKSTNDKAIKFIQTGKYSSGIIFSENQTKGKGTMGKKWISKKGNIFISIFFKVKFTKIKIHNFLIINAKIIKKILQPYILNTIKIKKPNDLLIKGKKICGILQEVIEYNNEKFLVTGIGINSKVNPNEKNLLSTSLKLHSNKQINNIHIVGQIKNIYEIFLKEFYQNNYNLIKTKYI